MAPKPKAMAMLHAASPVETREPQPERQAAPIIAIQETVAQPVEPRKVATACSNGESSGSGQSPRPVGGANAAEDYGPQTRRI